VRGFFSNPNIHPYQEYLRRAATLETFAVKVGLPVIWDRGYPWKNSCETSPSGDGALPVLLLPSPDRHGPGSPGGKFDAFTSTLLYSKFQNHELIKELGSWWSRRWGCPFITRTFARAGRRHGQVQEAGAYKQQYCGCIFSERDRFMQPEPGRMSPGKLMKK